MWRTVAYLDKLDRKRHFLSGLLDAEGSIIPIVDRKHENLRVRAQFTNTRYELVEYVMNALKELVFEPRIQVVEPGEEHAKRDGEVVQREKTLYKVYVDLNPSEITPLTKVGFNCTRKKLLLEFFLEIKDLRPRQRYEEFQRNCRKIGNKWALISFGWQRRQKLYIVEYKCGKAGVFELRKEADGEKVRIRVLVHHKGGTCEYNIAETVRMGDSAKIRCPKCGRPGYVNTTTRAANPKHPHRRLTVRISHKLGRRMPRCPLVSLRIPSIQTPQPPPAHQAETKA